MKYKIEINVHIKKDTTSKALVNHGNIFFY